MPDDRPVNLSIVNVRQAWWRENAFNLGAHQDQVERNAVQHFCEAIRYHPTSLLATRNRVVDIFLRKNPLERFEHGLRGAPRAYVRIGVQRFIASKDGKCLRDECRAVSLMLLQRTSKFYQEVGMAYGFLRLIVAGDRDLKIVEKPALHLIARFPNDDASPICKMLNDVCACRDPDGLRGELIIGSIRHMVAFSCVHDDTIGIDKLFSRYTV